jgi:hypothetical protein
VASLLPHLPPLPAIALAVLDLNDFDECMDFPAPSADLVRYLKFLRMTIGGAGAKRGRVCQHESLRQGDCLCCNAIRYGIQFGPSRRSRLDRPGPGT